MYGALRDPSSVAPWETKRSPRSLCELGKNSIEPARFLGSFLDACNNSLFEANGRCITLIWAMRKTGDVKLAIEEIAELPDGNELSGHPRRRNYPRHPAEEKKLGHPCLLLGEAARIAGELFLDRDESGDLKWYVNTNSGRFCRESPPTKTQERNVVELFKSFTGLDVVLDDIEEAI